MLEEDSWNKGSFGWDLPALMLLLAFLMEHLVLEERARYVESLERHTAKQVVLRDLAYKADLDLVYKVDWCYTEKSVACRHPAIVEQKEMAGA